MDLDAPAKSRSVTGSADAGAFTGDAIKFLVGSWESAKLSYGWRVAANRRSFYIKPLLGNMQDLKVSLHGPDPAHGFPSSGYKLARDRGAAAAVQRAGGALIEWSGSPEDKVFFPGYEVRPGVDLVVRFRFGCETLRRHRGIRSTPPRSTPDRFCGTHSSTRLRPGHRREHLRLSSGAVLAR
jgi:hypothetical protein